MPVSRAIWAASSPCAARPASSCSANPELKMTAARVPAAAQSAMTPGTKARPRTATMARSTACGTAPMAG